MAPRSCTHFDFNNVDFIYFIYFYTIQRIVEFNFLQCFRPITVLVSNSTCLSCRCNLNFFIFYFTFIEFHKSNSFKSCVYTMLRNTLMRFFLRSGKPMCCSLVPTTPVATHTMCFQSCSFTYLTTVLWDKAVVTLNPSSGTSGPADAPPPGLCMGRTPLRKSSLETCACSPRTKTHS